MIEPDMGYRFDRWALTTLRTVGYGDQMPVTTAGRLVAAAVMIAGVAVLGGVAALVALTLLRCGRKGLA